MSHCASTIAVAGAEGLVTLQASPKANQVLCFLTAIWTEYVVA